MRCNNCGWENPEGSAKCERCSSPLGNSVLSGTESAARYQQQASSNLRSTIREAVDGAYQNDTPYQSSEDQQQSAKNGNGTICSNCGYSLSPSMNVCPQCGTPQGKPKPTYEERQPNRKERPCPACGGVVVAGARFCPTCGKQLRNSGTVNAWDNPQGGSFCSLRPISWSREDAQYSAISYSGERIVLTRSNTDPNNQSITSKEQAVLTHDGNDWYIEDLSEQHSTMLRISRKTKLQSGDVIALGNRLFEFKD